MTSEDEALAIALLLRRTHGDQALAWIKEQIDRSAVKKDWVEIARWKAIAAACQDLEAGFTHQESLC